MRTIYQAIAIASIVIITFAEAVTAGEVICAVDAWTGEIKACFTTWGSCHTYAAKHYAICEAV